MNNFSVYIHKNKTNGKCYVGITGQNPIKRWGNGLGYKRISFYNAIKKYGWDGFEHIILFSNLTKQDAELIEIDLIHYYKKQKMSYNVVDGGNVTTGLKMSETARKNISNGHIGLPRSSETRQKISANNRKNKNWLAMNKANMKSVNQYTLDGQFIRTWDSVMDAEKGTGALHQNIAKCCRGKYKSSGGYKWKYSNEVVA